MVSGAKDANGNHVQQRALPKAGDRWCESGPTEQSQSQPVGLVDWLGIVGVPCLIFWGHVEIEFDWRWLRWKGIRAKADARNPQMAVNQKRAGCPKKNGLVK